MTAAASQQSFTGQRVPATTAGYYGTYNPTPGRMYGYPAAGLGNPVTSPTYPGTMPGYPSAPMGSPLSTYPGTVPTGPAGLSGLGGTSQLAGATAAYSPMSGTSPYGRPLP